MNVRELTLEQKKACIAYIISALTMRNASFICHAYSIFVELKTEMSGDDYFEVENHMHIIFPELYKGLKSLIYDDVERQKYNKNDGRTNYLKRVFNETYKCPIWYVDEIDERVHFLNDLNETLK